MPPQSTSSPTRVHDVPTELPIGWPGYRDEVLTAASDGQLDDETRATLEDALMASEDWLYEEETYEITDATVFEDRLAQVQSLVGAHLPRAAGGEGGSSDGPDDEPLDDDDLS